MISYKAQPDPVGIVQPTLCVLGTTASVGVDGPPPLPRMPERVLFTLAFNVDTGVSSRHLKEVLWQGRPPRSATTVLQTYVSQVRRWLAAGVGMDIDFVASNVLRTSGQGYLLSTDSMDVDFATYRAERTKGLALMRQADYNEAIVALEAAVQLWRCCAFDLVESEAYKEPVTELHKLTLLSLFKCYLEVGVHEEHLDQITQFGDIFIHDEPVQFLVARALFASGRRTDALTRIANVRRQLRDAAGLDVLAQMKDLELQILRAG